jgi:parvulin-like peptidyl-prolyl isomerase
MGARRLALALVLLSACTRSAEEPLLTPPPPPPPPSTGAAPVGAAPAPGAAAPAPSAAQPEEIRASHILIMHHESRSVPPNITRSRDEARARAQEVLGRVRRGEDFAALARQFSDEPGADRSAGDLNRFRRGMMVAPFEQAAFALQVGQVSDIVETPFGFHIIKRTE